MQFFRLLLALFCFSSCNHDDDVQAIGDENDEVEEPVSKVQKQSTLDQEELVKGIKQLDDVVYRNEKSLAHEVDMAKLLFFMENSIAERIAILRSDDELRYGIRREWLGPYWIQGQVSQQNSQYFERIVCVYLGGTPVNDEDVVMISSLTELRELFLHRTQISDRALVNIGSLSKLRVLHLRNTKITDKSVRELSRLSNLKELYLFETGISNSGGDALKKALPMTDVQWK